MPTWIYVVPVVVVLLIVAVMIPISKKKGKAIGVAMEKIRNMKVHLNFMLSGVISINGRPFADYDLAGSYCGVDETGKTEIEMAPCFTHANTTYEARTPFTVTFDTQEGHTYDLRIGSKKPKEAEENVVTVVPLTNQKIVFKDEFFLIVTDVTGDQSSEIMRGRVS